MDFADILKQQPKEEIEDFLLEILAVVKGQNQIAEMTINKLMHDRRDLFKRNVDLKDEIKKLQIKVNNFFEDKMQN